MNGSESAIEPTSGWFATLAAWFAGNAAKMPALAGIGTVISAVTLSNTAIFIGCVGTLWSMWFTRKMYKLRVQELQDRRDARASKLLVEEE